MTENMGIPIVRLEVESMRHTLVAAMTEHLAQMDTDFQAAINEACTSERVREALTLAVNREMCAAIENQVKDFFAYGVGYNMIRRMVGARLIQDLKKTPEYQESRKYIKEEEDE